MSGRFRQRAVVPLVEDNADDVVMIREAFEQSLTPIQLYVVSNGEQAIKFVRRTDSDAPRPSLILLDLNLPIRNGLDVLAELKSDTEFLSILIVIAYDIQGPDDIQCCYSLHANAYIIRPSDFDGFADVIKQVATCFPGLAIAAGPVILAMGQERGDSPVVMAGDERRRDGHQDLVRVRQAYPRPVAQGSASFTSAGFGQPVLSRSVTWHPCRPTGHACRPTGHACRRMSAFDFLICDSQSEIFCGKGPRPGGLLPGNTVAAAREG